MIPNKKHFSNTYLPFIKETTKDRGRRGAMPLGASLRKFRGNRVDNSIYKVRTPSLEDFSPTGAFIPHEWFKRITLANGKPDLTALMLLSDIVYWNRPTKSDEKKLKTGILRRTYDQIKDTFGFTLAEAKRALQSLEKMGLIKRGIDKATMLITLNAQALCNLTGFDNSSDNAMRDLDTPGTLIPHEWFKRITLANGKPDRVALTLLADTSYWYRPKKITDPITNEVTYKKKFQADLLQRSYAQLAKKFGFTFAEIRRALRALEDMGLMKRVFRSVRLSKSKKLGTAMFLYLDDKKLKSFDYTLQEEKKENIRKKILALKQRKRRIAITAQDKLGKPVPVLRCNPYTKGIYIKKIDKKSYIELSSKSIFFKDMSDPNKTRHDFEGNLDPQLARIIIAKSGRLDFSENFVCQKIKQFAIKYPNKRFRNKSALISYMGKSLRYELHDAVKTSKPDFVLKTVKTMQTKVSFGYGSSFTTSIKPLVDDKPTAADHIKRIQEMTPKDASDKIRKGIARLMKSDDEEKFFEHMLGYSYPALRYETDTYSPFRSGFVNSKIIEKGVKKYGSEIRALIVKHLNLEVKNIDLGFGIYL